MNKSQQTSRAKTRCAASLLCVCLFCAFAETLLAQSVVTVPTDAGVCTAVVHSLNLTTVYPGTVSYMLTGATTSITNSDLTDASGNTFNKGVTTVTYYNDDGLGPIQVAQFDVTVEDREPPALDNKPAIDIFLNTNGSYTLRADTLLTSGSDNCEVFDTLIMRTFGGSYAKTAQLNCGDADSTVHITIKLTDVSGMFTEKITLVTVKDTISPTVDKVTTLTGYLNGAGEFCLKADTMINAASDNCTAANELKYEVSRNGSLYKDTLLFHCGDTIAAGKAVFVKVTDESGNTAKWSAAVFVKDTIAPVVLCKSDYTVYLDSVSGKFRLTPKELLASYSDNCTSDDDLTFRLMINNDGVLLSDSTFYCEDAGRTLSAKVFVRDEAGNESSGETDFTVQYYADKLPDPVIVPDPANNELCNNSKTQLRLSNEGFDHATEWQWTTAAPTGVTGNASGSAAGQHVIRDSLTNHTNAYQEVTYAVSATLYGRCSVTGIADTVAVNPTPLPASGTDSVICNETHARIPLRSTSTVSASATVMYRWEVSHSGITGGSDGQGLPAGDTLSQLLRNTTSNTQKAVYALSPYLRLNGVSCPSGLTVTTTIAVQPHPNFNISPAGLAVCSGDTVRFNALMGNALEQAVWQYSTALTIPDQVTVTGTPETCAGSFDIRFDNDANRRLAVPFTFKPFITIAEPHTLRQHVCSKHDSTVVNITVHPVPRMTLSFSGNDSICFDEGTGILLATPNVREGTEKYQLWRVTYPGDSVRNVDLVPAEYDASVSFIDQSNVTNISDGVQTVRYFFTPVNDISGKRCTGSDDSITVHIAPRVKFQLAALTYSDTVNIRCYNEQNGAIYVTGKKGGWHSTGGYDCRWAKGNSQGAITAADTVAQLGAGIYTFTLSDKVHGCLASQLITLIQPDELVVKADTARFLNPVCLGTKGALYLSVTGGIKEYGYDWTGPQLRDGIFKFYEWGCDSLEAGMYDIQVTDANLCQSSIQQEIKHGSPGRMTQLAWNPNPNIYTTNSQHPVYNISCHGAGDGSLNPNPGPDVDSILVYKWHFPNGDSLVEMTAGKAYSFYNSDFRISHLDAGMYKFTVIDHTGCIWKDSVTLRQPDPIAVDVTIQHPDCYQSASGEIHINNVSGGFSDIDPATYDRAWKLEWSAPSDHSAHLTQLRAGQYQLTVTDTVNLHGAHTCSDTLRFELDEPDMIGVTRTNAPPAGEYDLLCHGNKTGSIQVAIDGNYSNNEYRWTNAEGEELGNEQNIDSLYAGIYRIHIAYGESKSCVFEKAFEITEPAPIESGESIVPVSCFGGSDGKFFLNPTGGNGGYTFKWYTTALNLTNQRPELVNAQNLVNVPAGWYTPVITDSKKCEKMLPGMRIPEPDHILSNIQSTDPPCVAGGTGSITLHPINGTGNYHYLWNDGSTAKDRDNLPPAGKYYVTITDDNGCSTEDSASIHIPKDLQVTAVVEKDIACYGDEGIVTLNILNARGNLSYQHIADGSAFDPQHAPAGSYAIRVTDDFQCSGTANVVLNQPAKMELVQATVTDLNCYGAENGAISVEVSGGMEPYTYQWSNSMTTPTIHHLKAGKYEVNIFDARHCKTVTSFEVTQPAKMLIHIETTDACCPEFPDGKMVAWAEGGSGTYRYLWKESGSHLPNMDEVPSGTYTLEVTDDNQCVATQTVTVGFKQDVCLNIPNVFSPNGDGANDRWEIFAGNPEAATVYTLGDIYPEAIVEVYSASWGVLLYRSQKGYPEPWDGRYNGNVLPVNSYVYVIRLTKDRKAITGNVMIIK
ncbi:MAG: gliding motility-associated C-terminal domain-containing protein [Bacteroidales bacterium]|nr:gliding motility-associated C-terminal domain-containing protein [Bacteroidales bacterium]